MQKSSKKRRNLGVILEKQFRIDPTHLPVEKERILRQAQDAMQRPIAHITDVTAL